jgi:hypothetical protein
MPGLVAEFAWVMAINSGVTGRNLNILGTAAIAYILLIFKFFLKLGVVLYHFMRLAAVEIFFQTRIRMALSKLMRRLKLK